MRIDSINSILLAIGDELDRANLGWAVAGGWAIDLFLGVQTRPHNDYDIAVWRDEQRTLFHALPRWTLQVAHEGTLRPWHGEPIEPRLHELHAKRPDGLAVEFLLNDRDDTDWIYRRDPAVRTTLSGAIQRREDVPFLAPQVVLLYKSKQPRELDDQDFESALPRLSTAARQWLAEALMRADTSHPWIQRLVSG